MLLGAPAHAAATDPLTGEGSQSFGSTGSPNNFEKNTLNDVVGGAEIPYTGSAPIQITAPTIDTSGYDLDPGEANSTGNYNGCRKAGGIDVFAGRTAWYRFNPGVAGNLAVLATTLGYDSILMLRPATKVAWGSTQFSDFVGHAGTCADVHEVAGSEGISTFPVTPDLAYYIQVGGKCPTNSPTSCNDPAVPGGDTTIRITFTPADSDGDGVPDTQDACSGGVPGGVNSVGCPDRDHDEVADTDDRCPDLPGVASNDRFNGCPAGPNPPKGLRAEVTVVSLTGDALNTSSTDVQLLLDWRQGTRQVLVDNGSGQAPVAVDFASGVVRWRLDPANKSETRQVKVQFLGPGIDDRDTDTITLDVTAPTVPRSVVLPPSGGDYAVGFKVTDGKAGSGVRAVTLLDKKHRKISQTIACKKSCVSVQNGLESRKTPRYLRVVDKAGNERDVKLPKAQKGCRVQVLSLVNYGDTDCFPIGSSCTRADTLEFDFEARHLACRGGVVVRTRR